MVKRLGTLKTAAPWTGDISLAADGCRAGVTGGTRSPSTSNISGCVATFSIVLAEADPPSQRHSLSPEVVSRLYDVRTSDAHRSLKIVEQETAESRALACPGFSALLSEAPLPLKAVKYHRTPKARSLSDIRPLRSDPPKDGFAAANICLCPSNEVCV